MRHELTVARCAPLALLLIGCSSSADGARSIAGISGATAAGGSGGATSSSESGSTSGSPQIAVSGGAPAAGPGGAGGSEPTPAAGGAGNVQTGGRTDGGGALTPPDMRALGTLTACSGTVTDIFSKSAIQPPATGSGIYDPADPALRDALDRSIRALVGGDVSTALSSASIAGYDVCRADDSGSLVVVWRPHVTGQGHAVVAWRPDPTTPLIIGAPHAFHDVDTELEAPEMFVALKARALVLSGIYRCASLAAGPCDGITTACTGLPIPYTISDAAHNSEMFFQAAHVALADSFPNDLVTSLHGMPDPGISISNGTQMSPAADSFQVRLFNELTAAFPGEQITSCQALAGTTASKRWCGSENVQGREVNGAPDVCAANATVTSNRFVHVEQARNIRSTERAQVIAAFGNALK